MNITEARLIRAIDVNFNLHARKIPEQCNDMLVVDLDDLTYVDSGLSCDTFNIIHIVNGQSISDDFLKKALDHYRTNNLQYCVWINADNLTDGVRQKLANHSLVMKNEEVGMTLDLKSYTHFHQEEHANIKLVDSVSMVKDFAKVISENWTPPDLNVLKYYELTSEKYLADRNISLLTYYSNEKPVSTVELFASGDETIGLYGFATLKDFRGRGIGTTLLTFALNKAKEMGFEVAILQASEDGISIYKKYGFKERIKYFEYAQ